jgi:methyl-accepting chemotaxis protein
MTAGPTLLAVGAVIEAIAGLWLWRTARQSRAELLLARSAAAEASAERTALQAQLAAAPRTAPQPTNDNRPLDSVVAEASQVGELLSTTVETVLSIATAAEQLTASSSEIATCASEATRVSSDAVRLASEAIAHVETLGRNGDETARIAALIQSVSERTRILSLNTTIEAGRAGDAGQAMGAIATHIRALAEDAAKGTQAISSTLDASAQDIAHVNTAITQVAEIATEVQHYQAAIAAAVEEQTTVTGEIARAAHQAERDGAEVSRQLAQLAASLARATSPARAGVDG